MNRTGPNLVTIHDPPHPTFMPVPFPLIKLHQLYRLVRESHAQPMRGEPRPLILAPSGQLAVTFIGHSSFLVQLAGRNLLIDPVFATRLILLRRQRRPGLCIPDLPRIDAVLLTHAHMDHLNLPSLRAILRQMRRSGHPAPLVIVPAGVEDLVANLGFARTISLDTWQSVELTNDVSSQPATDPGAPCLASETWAEPPPTLTITLTPAKHWGARLFTDTHRHFGGYTLAHGATTLYHSGDTAYFPGFTEIRNRLHPTLALLPIGAYFPDSYRAVHTSPEEALQAFLDLGADALVPMHYNTFRLGREPMSEPLPRLLAAATRAGLLNRIHPLAEGETWLPNNN